MARESRTNCLFYASVSRALRWRRAALALGLAAASATLGTGVAVAQQQGDSGARGLDEVIVTARRREEDIQTVPQTIDVLGGAELKELGKVTFKDLQFEVPGLYIENY